MWVQEKGKHNSPLTYSILVLDPPPNGLWHLHVVPCKLSDDVVSVKPETNRHLSIRIYMFEFIKVMNNDLHRVNILIKSILSL